MRSLQTTKTQPKTKAAEPDPPAAARSNTMGTRLPLWAQMFQMALSTTRKSVTQGEWQGLLTRDI